MIQKLCDSVMNNQLGWQEKPAQEITAFLWLMAANLGLNALG